MIPSRIEKDLRTVFFFFFFLSSVEVSIGLTFFNLVKNDLSLRPTIQNYCIIVHILTWSRKFYQATNLLSELIEMVKVVSPDDDDVLKVWFCAMKIVIGI